MRTVRQALGPWRRGWQRLRRNVPALVGCGIVALLVVLALIVPVLTSLGLLPDPLQLNLEEASAGPRAGHLLGSDNLGRDLASRVLYGTRYSLLIAILVQPVRLVFGGTIGLIAGFFGGRIDNLLMRLVDAVQALPDLLLVIVVAAIAGPGYWTVFLALAVAGWSGVARLVRGQVLALREQDYIESARASGASRTKLVFRHLLPHALGPVVVSLSFAVPGALFAEAFLSFIGIGIRPPAPSWGVMLRDGYQAIYAYPWQILAPTLAIALTTLAFQLLGDGLRDALDPRTVRQRLSDVRP